MTSNENLNQTRLAKKVEAALDSLFDKLYNYHGHPLPPREVLSEVWAAPAKLPEQVAGASDYFLHYFQSQGLGPTTNECVTTSTVMGMNIIEDRIAASQRMGPPRYQADLRIEDYIHELDGRGIAGWWYRFSTKSPLPGMMMTWGARNALRRHAEILRRLYGKSYQVKLRTHLSVDDLIQGLEQKQVMLLHGAWQKRLSDTKDRHLAVLGGMPHTMLLVGYTPATDTWNLLNPAEPWLKTRSDPFPAKLFRMTTEQLVDFWGRKFLFYPPRFSVTAISMEA